ncbi:transporter substrate-binding domain-containing protein [Alteromonas sp. a30]|uniref:transporter substrate-binding domain-containing protein n=1 Tax=Alteromonas sp. a30 TaxID=2730917 RepID=UPI0022822820|nr:transporter substrate-binding domain-containing protein [Alteromonas sp. a30]MCY7296648.1 transporter substrate-binding domain-containing protein [Alteromonas sp. a30]
MRIYLPLFIIFFLFGCIPSDAIAAQKPVKFIFCYENKEVLPHFTGSGRRVPEHFPGATIEIMQELNNQVAAVQIQFVRYPWKRCLSDLRDGYVDGVIGRYSDERANFGVYPRKSSGDLDSSKAMLSNQTCFIFNRRRTDFTWDGKTLVMSAPVSVSVPSGYQLIQDLSSKGLEIYETNTINLAHRLLFNGRVDASVANCKEQNLPLGFEHNPIPVVSNSGYLIFSQPFYKMHTPAAKALWEALESLDKEAFYNKYADYH